ncbi:MAG: DUF106 domain-containing protein [Hadesarchaea archaeon]|nr:MAG: DUF106 domain-containing protein [Hadesarchaea archaeon]
MRRVLVCSLIAAFLLASFAMTVGAEEAEDEHETYKGLLQTVDSSIISLRQGGSASGSLSQARTLYNSLVGPYENDNFGGSPKLIEIDNRITQAFNSLQQSATEENIRVLRSDISLMASELGIGLSSIYEYALFVVLGIGIFVSLLITLVTRRVVNWERMREIKAEVSAFQKELREAQRKQDMKSVHNLQQDQKRIMALQGQMMKENFKPTLFYIVPYFIFWFILMGIYGGWVVAWLPFRLDLPFFGTWVSCGFLSWYLLTYFGSSQIWRKLLIRD